ncbi:MAG: response regulator [Eubacterium sp.]|nr:response regulator [Eubacterium sp.]
MNDILLIAENKDIIRSFTDMLSPAYNVNSVNSEQEGIEVLKKDIGVIAAVLIELKLARKSGFIFSDQIQDRFSMSDIPLIAITGEYPADEDMDCIEHGFFDIISEFSPEPLVYQRIRNAIRAKGSLSLTEVEKMLRELPSCIFLKDSQGRYVFSTQYWRHLDTGGDPNWTIRGKTDMDIRKDKENAKKAMEADRRILETGKGTEYVIEENEDGIKEYLQLIKRPVFDEDGRVNGIIALINNVTDYQLLKQKLEKHAKTDDQMITAMSNDYRIIFHVDLDKDECLCVRATEQTDGDIQEGSVFSFKEGFDDYAKRYVADSDREAFLDFVKPEKIRAGLAEDAMISHRYLTVRDGAERYEMVKMAGVRPIEERERDDNIVHAIAVGFSDVDHETREQMEQNRALTEALARAEEANAAKTAFLSSMSHEIRTPMNAIIGLDSIALHEENIPKHIRDEFEKIGASARHLLALINDILDMSRIESGRMVLKDEAFSFRGMLEQIDIIISGQCDDKGLIYESRVIGDTDDYFIGDDLRVRQIIINILGNSVKFTDPPGTVTFTAEQTDSEEDISKMRFTMKDTGVGMSKEFLPKLFDPFSQEDDTTTNRYGGSGLGMALTKNMVDLMGGAITVDSEKGRGTTFTVTIPLKRAHDIRPAETDEQPEKEVSLAGLHVLFAEDVEMNAEILTDLLEMEDITSEWAENGKKAVELFDQSDVGQFDVILMDMRMPVMDGLAATREIRKLDRPDAKTIPIIALTANAFEEDVKACLDAGMNAHISKPVDIDKLKDILGRIR